MNKRLLCGVAVMAAFGLVLGGCGKKPDKNKEGQATVTFGNTKVQAKDENSTAAIPLPPNMPAYAAVYPGGNVMAVVTMSDEETGTMISYSTKAKPEDVIAFYKKNAKAASLESLHEMQIAGAWTFAAQSKDSEKTVTVTIMANEGEQQVQEVYR